MSKTVQGEPSKALQGNDGSVKSGQQGKRVTVNKLQSSSPNDALCQVWLKLAQWFWRRR